MLLREASLNCINGTVDSGQSAGFVGGISSWVFGSRSVQEVSPQELLSIKTEIEDAAKNQLKLKGRNVTQVPDSLPALRQHPVVRTANLEQLLLNIARNDGIETEDFRLALDEKLQACDATGTRLSSADQHSILSYLQEKTIPFCYGYISNTKREARLHAATEIVEAAMAAINDAIASDRDTTTSDSDGGYSSASDDVVLPDIPDADRSLSTKEQELVTLMCTTPDRYIGAVRIEEYGCQYLVRSGLVDKNELLKQPERTMHGMKVIWDDVCKRARKQARARQPVPAIRKRKIDRTTSSVASAASTAPVPEYDVSSYLNQHGAKLSQAMLGDIKSQLPAQEWGSLRVCKELLTLYHCNRYGADLSAADFIRLHKNNDITDDMIETTLEHEKGSVYEQAMMLTNIILRNKLNPPPKAKRRAVNRPSAQPRTVAASFNNPPTDSLVHSVVTPRPGSFATDEQLKRQLQSATDHKGQPLVKNDQDFYRLFNTIDLRQYSHDQLIQGLKHFRRAQSCEQEAGVVFTRAMFGPLMGLGLHKQDPTHVKLELDAVTIELFKGDGIDLEADARKEQVSGLFKSVCKIGNFDPDVTGAERLHKAGIEPAGCGLFNYSNVCFMNGTLQALSGAWQRSGVLDEIRHGIPLGVLVNNLDELTPGVTERTPESQNRRMQQIWQQARAMQANPDQAIAQDQPPGIAARIQAYRKLATTFLALSDGLNQPGRKDTLVSAQRAFIDAYREYGETRGKKTVQYVLQASPTDPNNPLILAKIRQQDPEEFWTSLVEAFGVEFRPQNTIGTFDTYTLQHQGHGVDTEVVQNPHPTHMLRLPIQGHSLEDCFTEFSKQEPLAPSEEKDWPERRLQQLGVQQWSRDRRQQYGRLKRLEAMKPASMSSSQKTEMRTLQALNMGEPTTTTSKRIQLLADDRAPGQMVLQLKLYQNDASGVSRYRRQEGRELLQSMPLEMTLPVYKRTRHGQPEFAGNSRYQVNSIVCHRGDSLTSGHYMTIKFEPSGRVVVCDDDIVTDLNSYAKYHGRKYQNWRDLCEREGLSPYLITVDKIE